MMRRVNQGLSHVASTRRHGRVSNTEHYTDLSLTAASAPSPTGCPRRSARTRRASSVWVAVPMSRCVTASPDSGSSTVITRAMLGFETESTSLYGTTIAGSPERKNKPMWPSVTTSEAFFFEFVCTMAHVPSLDSASAAVVAAAYGDSLGDSASATAGGGGRGGGTAALGAVAPPSALLALRVPSAGASPEPCRMRSPRRRTFGDGASGEVGEDAVPCDDVFPWVGSVSQKMSTGPLRPRRPRTHRISPGTKRTYPTATFIMRSTCHHGNVRETTRMNESPARTNRVLYGTRQLNSSAIFSRVSVAGCSSVRIFRATTRASWRPWKLSATVVTPF
mmetsp:Transcript_14836/g.43969  ORF Transcript_14836/g.43969 Transcript_14836/m.43969 type:complete len:335 (-) Transcript_14836:637-1641(-)